jgi:hypothetical protein
LARACRPDDVPMPSVVPRARERTRGPDLCPALPHDIQEARKPLRLVILDVQLVKFVCFVANPVGKAAHGNP